MRRKMRLIDADALIAKWEEEAKHITEFAHPGMVYGIINDVKRQPTIEAPRWIPCSERLPEYGIDVLTVDRYGEYELNHIIDEEDGEWYWEKPIAWRPLPEPYKEGEKECG